MKGQSGILIKNIYYLLSYAFENLHNERFRKQAVEEFSDANSLFAALLASGLAWQRSQGLARQYLPVNDELGTVRGKIQLARSIALLASRKALLACEFDELSEDCLINQVIKSTALLLLNDQQIDHTYRVTLRNELRYLGHVRPINLTQLDWRSVFSGRLRNNYALLLNICWLLSANLLPSDSPGKYRLADFVDSQGMARLWEKFLLAYYRKHFALLNPRSEVLNWSLEVGSGMSLPQMRTDISLNHGDKYLILDAKFYSRNTVNYFNKEQLHAGHIYQIYSYARQKALQLGDEFQVGACLVYAGTGELVQPNFSHATDEVTLSAVSVDLTRDFTELRAQLDRLVVNYFEL